MMGLVDSNRQLTKGQEGQRINRAFNLFAMGLSVRGDPVDAAFVFVRAKCVSQWTRSGGGHPLEEREKAPPVRALFLKQEELFLHSP